MGKKVGSIKICMGSSCFSRGNGLNAELIQRLIADGSLSADVEFSGTLCEGMCVHGPIVVVDGLVHEKVTPSMLQDILVLEEKD